LFAAKPPGGHRFARPRVIGDDRDSEIRAVQEAERVFRYFVESVTEYALFTVSPDGFVASWNVGARRTFGYSAAEIVGKPFDVLFVPDDIANARPAEELAIALAQGRNERDCWHMRADGTRFWATNTVQPLCNDDGQMVGFSNIVRDSTERHVANIALRESDERFRILMESVADYAILFLTPCGDIAVWNSGAEAMFGYAAEDVLNRNVSLLFMPPALRDAIKHDIEQDLTRIVSEERWYFRKQGSTFFATTRLTALEPAPAGADRGYVMIVHDITRRKYEEEALRRKAFYDELTGLPNRALFLERYASSRRQTDGDAAFAVLFVDLDGFKALNDKYGHATADVLLRQVSDDLEHSVRPDDFVARLSGDEFAILLERIESPQLAQDVAERTRRAIAKDYHVGGASISVTASIGVACGSRNGRAEQALGDADFAMYEAKQRGRNQCVLFDETMDVPSPSRRLMESQLHDAVERKEFIVEYQPIVELVGLRLVGFEALIRWRHPRRGTIAAAEFVPMAERSGLIASIDRWVFETASRQLSQWQHDPRYAGLTMSVNVSTIGLDRPDTLEVIAGSLRRNPMTPGTVKIEITESVQLETSVQAMATLAGLRSLGLEIHLDDFGVGYSSLDYLRRCNASALKIDRSFVSGVTGNDGAGELVRAIISLAHTLRLLTIAEGVETEEEMALLRDANCDFAQGFLFGRSLSSVEATALIENNVVRLSTVLDGRRSYEGAPSA
jgi:diguanylate cyclase (GGDEF)-like protein/PAS domain S-box-containing protein